MCIININFFVCLPFVCSGFIELLTRLSNSGKLAAFSHVDESVDNYVPRIETLLRVMDSSGGKEKLIKSHRRSVCVRHFKYYPK